MVQKSPDRDALCRKLTTGQATDLLATCQERRVRYRGYSQHLNDVIFSVYNLNQPVEFACVSSFNEK